MVVATSFPLHLLVVLPAMGAGAVRTQRYAANILSRTRVRHCSVALKISRSDVTAVATAASVGEELVEPLPPSDPIRDNPFALFMIYAFRLVMSHIAGWKSPKRYIGGELGESYEGLVEESRYLFAGSPAETADRVKGVLRAFPTSPQLLQDNKVSAELLGLLTPVLFPFLVGECNVEDWAHPSGQQWKSKVVVKKCRFLEVSACKGMCVGLCKEPTESFFSEELGLPLSMEPNYEDGSCTMTWGASPRPLDASQNTACYSHCGLRAAVHHASQGAKASAECDILSTGD